ncbi:putative autotransporter adhesin-like protein [Pseudoduganella flava]|uniref:DUF2807 domain-containing protein n=1 Tax=Pseudoduganella flava TaxID=871742 RepID=A0A562PAI8_9BURK|nr:DUF2807 domain-containing protein [Pseudoduganella flava]QGZ42740.1 DUF2807 domain-containing protein [Pseudoduganella flava]TWI41006.1 putative autotransporter adhesin-like protein [Pseudoduganella flava]
MRPPTLSALPALIATILAGCVIVVPGDRHAADGATLEGDGNVVAETRAVDGAPALELAGRRQVDLDVAVQVGAAPALSLEGDANVLAHLHTETRGGTLRIWSDRDVHATQPVRVRYTVPRLERLETAGSAGTHVSGLAGGTLHVVQRGSGRIELRGHVDRLEAVNSGSGRLVADALDAGSARVALNGSGRVSVGGVHGDALQAQLYGSGTLTARGEVRQADVTVYGSGDAELAGLHAASADLATTGSGDIAIAVTGRVTTHTNGAGSITIYGDPLERSVAGKGTAFVR